MGLAVDRYDRSRSVLYDTRSGSFLPPEPRRYVGAALRRREAQQCAPLSAAGIEISSAVAACAEGEARVIFAAEDHLNPLHHVMQLEMIKVCSNPRLADQAALLLTRAGLGLDRRSMRWTSDPLR